MYNVPLALRTPSRDNNVVGKQSSAYFHPPFHTVLVSETKCTHRKCRAMNSGITWYSRSSIKRGQLLRYVLHRIISAAAVGVGRIISYRPKTQCFNWKAKAYHWRGRATHVSPKPLNLYLYCSPRLCLSPWSHTATHCFLDTSTRWHREAHFSVISAPRLLRWWLTAN
jgi:hypothetical protein